MSEIARCPVCGEVEPYLGNVFGDLTGYGCCGAEFITKKLWNQYAAAMELAKAYAWENEVNETRNWMDESCAISAPWEEIIESSIASERELFAADDAVLEAFK